MRILTPLVMIVAAVLLSGCGGDGVTGPVDERSSASFTPTFSADHATDHTECGIGAKTGCEPPTECAPDDPDCKGGGKDFTPVTVDNLPGGGCPGRFIRAADKANPADRNGDGLVCLLKKKAKKKKAK